MSASDITSDAPEWYAFDGVSSTRWRGSGGQYTNGDANSTVQLSSSSSTPNGSWIKVEFPHKLKINKMRISGATTQSPKDGELWTSNNDSDWTQIFTFSNMANGSAGNFTDFNFTPLSSDYFKYFALIVTKTGATNETLTSIYELEYYGYEEDPPAGDHSVDTTFKSRFNNPQLTGVQVLVDGATGVGTNQISGGPDPSGNQATMTSPNKYWTLNGTLTSNLSVEANTFLEGDQPHAVSVWFNSSNLEANVSNTCVFSIASEEKLDSVNLDLQSNTWHNLTYAYQGEGGSKVTYLDGRKVAEDQAEDTFGDYPPFAMTGYSQGGYVVSASSPASGSYQAWLAFNDFTSNNQRWQTTANTYDSNGNWVSGVGATGVQFTDTNGGQHSGEWIKLEMPHKLKLSYISYLCNYTTFMTKDFVILGSNDDTTWTLLKSVTGGTAVEDVHHNLIINANHSYKYFVWLTSAINGGSGEVLFNDIKFYGHRENDLVRLPDPTNVLKYPHVAMTGPAQRGYVAKVSSQTSTTVDYPHRIFDGDDTTQFRSALNTYTSGTANTTDNLKTQTSAGGTVTINGSWISIELPHKLILQSTRVVSNDGTSHVPERLIIYGSNDITNDGWTEVDTTYKSADANIPHAGTGKTWTTTASSTGYKNFALAVSQIESNTGNNRLVVSTWELYGTGVDSVPIQIGGGNIDKVANFRVYDKFIGEDQVNEIWNAQKEEFGRAKPQMVLQQGKLGIGTDAPQGSLSVADEPHVPEEFPPRAMSGYKNYFEGHGEFCASASSWYNQASSASPVYSWNAFNKGALGFSTGNGHGNNWETSTPASYSDSTGLYTGASGFYTAGIGGDWVQLELPYAIKLARMELMPMYYNDGTYTAIGPARSPQDGHIMASNDGLNWISIYNWVSRTDFTNLEYTKFKVPETVTKAYKYFRVVWTRTNYTAPGASNLDEYASVGEIKFFGTREQGQSVLHDGQLTLTKSLNVPRIGPPLDADDTPRRDRLVVEYNTSTEPHL